MPQARCKVPQGVLAAVLIAVSLWSRDGRAQETPSARHVRSIVEITAAGATEATASLESLVRELVRPLQIELAWSVASTIESRDVLAHHDARPGLVARVWADLRE